MSSNELEPKETHDQMLGEYRPDDERVIEDTDADTNESSRDDGLDPDSLEAFVRNQSSDDSGSENGARSSSDWSDENGEAEDSGASESRDSPSVEPRDDHQPSNSTENPSQQSHDHDDEVSGADDDAIPETSDDQFPDSESVTPAGGNPSANEDDELLSSRADGGAAGQNATDDEVRSAFSDDSDSDSDGWAEAALAQFKAQTAEIVARQKARRESVEGAYDSDWSDFPADANGSGDSEIRGDEDNSHAQSNTEEQEQDLFQDATKPWLRKAGVRGALLPIGAVSDEDLYRRDINFYHYGHQNISRSTSVDPRSCGKPSLLNPDGTLRRVQSQLDLVREQRNQLATDFEIIEGELKAAKTELDEDRQQIGMLKHAVDTRDKNLKAWKDYAENTVEQWKTAFEEQRPLADAERERLALIESGYEFQQDADTQTSPIEIAIAVPPINSWTQTDAVDPDTEDVDELARERDELVSENGKLTDQVMRLKTLLEDSKEWIDARTWELKGSSKSSSQTIDNASRAVSTISAAPSVLSPSVSLARFRDIELPSDSAMLGWPQHWIDREEEMRKSASWIQARDKVEAELSAWQRQLWAGANTSAALRG